MLWRRRYHGAMPVPATSRRFSLRLSHSGSPIPLQVSADLHERILSRAAAAGEPVSAWVRGRLCAAAGVTDSLESGTEQSLDAAARAAGLDFAAWSRTIISACCSDDLRDAIRRARRAA